MNYLSSGHPASLFGYRPEFTNIRVGTLDDVLLKGLRDGDALHFNAANSIFVSKSLKLKTRGMLVASGANSVYTPDQILDGLIIRELSKAGVVDVVPSAKSMLKVVSSAAAGDAHIVRIMNKSEHKLGLIAQDGSDLNGCAEIPPKSCTTFLMRILSATPGSEKIDFLCLGHAAL